MTTVNENNPQIVRYDLAFIFCLCLFTGLAIIFQQSEGKNNIPSIEIEPIENMNR